MSQQSSEPRAVVSYVRRSPRMNPSQRQALDRLGPRYLVEVARGELGTSIAAGARVDWASVFGHPVGPTGAPLRVELGSGTGDALVADALAHPEAALVAFEVYERAVASTLVKLDAGGIDNVRLLTVDAVQGLAQLFEPGQISRLATWFPDPWQKKRHHKRRLVNPAFAALVASRLAPGGHWLLATDWPDYAEQIRLVLEGCPELVNEYPGGAPRPADRPITKFERRGLADGRPVTDFDYRRL